MDITFALMILAVLMSIAWLVHFLRQHLRNPPFVQGGSKSLGAVELEATLHGHKRKLARRDPFATAEQSQVAQTCQMTV